MVRRGAHDFNYRIAVVRGYASVLQGRPVLDQDSRELVGLIEQAGSELAALTEQMAKFEDTEDSEFSWFNLNSVILAFVNEDRDQSVQGIEVESKLNDVPELWGDPQIIGDMCQKLWLNALDFVVDGGRITFETSLKYYDVQKQNRKTNLVNLGSNDNAISSNGADGQSSSLTNGNGKTAYALLRVTSELGKGTSVEVYLPLPEGSQVQPI